MKKSSLFFLSFIIVCHSFSLSATDHEIDESDSSFNLFGFISLYQGNTNAQASWLENGFGRFDGGNSALDNASYNQYEAQIALEWFISDSTFLYLHTRSSKEDTSESTKAFGLVEGFIDYSFYSNDTSEFSMQLGQTFLSSSQENINALWQSPYTLNLSTWNSWIAHEFRPIGLNFNYQFETFEGDTINLGIGVFKGNDSLGSQLAWGGWRISHRLTVLNEVLPLGPLFTLENDAQFSDQRDDGSKPIGSDLDDRFGFHALAKWQISDWFNLKLSFVDNNGDRKLWNGEYAWETSFINLGSRWQINQNWEMLGEWVEGKTGMGILPISVDVDFKNTYLITSWHKNNNRISLRIEKFSVSEKDFSNAENNNDTGDAWTLSWMVHTDSPWRFAIEYTVLKTENIAQSQSGFKANNNDKLFSLEIRREFD